MKNLFNLKTIGCAMLLSFSFCTTLHAQTQKNVILFIGDGMAVAQWQTGMIANKAPLNINKMKTIGLMTTNAANKFAGDGPSNGTALATGVQSLGGFIALDKDSMPLKSIIDYADEAGIASGVVAASTLAEGSIAPFVAHAKNRMQTDKITAAYLEHSHLDVFISGGQKIFVERKDNRDIMGELQKKGYQVVTSIDSIRNIKSGKLAGFTAYESNPGINEGRGNMLPDAVQTALNILSSNAKKGLFLVVQDTYIDKDSHFEKGDLVGMETIDFDKAIGNALDYADRNKNTVVIVVGGPEASGMSLPDANPKEGSVNAKWTEHGMIHTGVMVPIFAYGVDAQQFQGIQDNTDIFFKIKKILLGK